MEILPDCNNHNCNCHKQTPYYYHKYSHNYHNCDHNCDHNNIIYNDNNIHSDKLCCPNIQTDNYNNMCINNEYLLDFILWKYKIKKDKLINAIINMKDEELKKISIKIFYAKFKPEECISIDKIYCHFSTWYLGYPIITLEEFKYYYDAIIKDEYSYIY